jgi:hypothetical protein
VTTVLVLTFAGAAVASTISRASALVKPYHATMKLPVLRAFRFRPQVTSVPGCTSVVITNTKDGYYPGVTAATVYSSALNGATLNQTATSGAFCDVQLYVPPTATNAVIANSVIANGRLAGILVDGTKNVRITNTTVSTVGDGYEPGEVGLYGYQDGIAIDFETGTGRVDHTLLLNYQKNGTEFYLATIEFDHNTAIGTYGPPNTAVFNNGYDVIAQNGFEADSSVVSESNNATFSNQYYNPSDTLYNRQASGFLFGLDTKRNGSPFTCADFTADRDIAPSDILTGVGNDIPFYAAANYMSNNCPAATGGSFNPTS